MGVYGFMSTLQKLKIVKNLVERVCKLSKQFSNP